jgi:hypothetical protein
MISISLWVTLLATLVAGQSQDSCYADQTDPYIFFGTATPYEAVSDTNASYVYIDSKFCNISYPNLPQA